MPEAKAQLSDLIARVERGEHITITQDGRPVAKLVPTDAAPEKPDRAEVIARLKAFSKGQTTGGIGWKALRDGGRKY